MVHSGETFTRPRPQDLEFSEAFGFVSALKAKFRLDREKNDIYEQLEPLRKKMSCARLARDLNKRWIEWYCLNQAFIQIPRNFGFLKIITYNKNPFCYRNKSQVADNVGEKEYWKDT